MIWGALALAAYAALAWIATAIGPWSEHLGLYWCLHAVAWIACLGAARSRTSRGTVIAGAVLFRLLLLFVAPSLSDDVYRYIWEGRVQRLGFDPYLLAPDAPALAPYRDAVWAQVNHRHLAAIYPPLAQLVFRGLAGLGGVTVFKAAFCGFDLLLVLVLVRALARRGAPPARAALYAWNPLAVVEVAASGHLEPLALLPLAAGVLWAQSRRPIAAWAAFACSVAARYAALAAAPAFARGARLELRAAIAAVAVVGAAFAAFAGSGPHLFDSLRVYADHWRSNDLVFAALQAVTGDATRARTVAVVLAVVVAIASLRLAFPAGMVLSLGATLALAPVVHPWYVLWPLALVPLAPSGAILVWSATAPLAYHFLYPAFGRAPARFEDWGWMGVAMAPVAIAACFDARRALRARHARENRMDLATTAGKQSAAGVGTASAATAATPRVALVMPVLDEEPALPLVFADLEPLRRDRAGAARDHADRSALVDTLVVVDNGSRDRSPDLARAAGATVLFEPERGYGAACQRALAHLRAATPPPDIVVFMDADRSDDAAELPALVAPILSGNFDLVIGSRTRGAHEAGALLPQARFGNWLATGWIRLWYGFRYTDLGPFRAIRRDSLDRLGMRDRDWGWTLEMQVRALHAGLRVTEVPVRYRRRIGRSKISGTLLGSARAARKIVWTMWTLRRAPDGRAEAR